MFRFLIRELYRAFKYLYFGLRYRVSTYDFTKQCVANYLVFSHNMGGGTEQYVNNNFYDGAYLIVRNIAPYKRLGFCIVENVKLHKKFFLNNKHICDLFDNEYKCLIVNSVTDSYNAFQVLELCRNYKMNHSGTQLIYLVHDYNCICPTNYLIADGFFCRLKCDQYKCQTALPILEWRSNWRNFLQCCDEIRCFSESSRQIVLSAYPVLCEDKIIVKPHDMSYAKFTPLAIPDNTHPVVAVVGRCVNEAKGVKVIPKILEGVSEKIRFVFVGTDASEICVSRRNVSFLGKYRQEELQQILSSEKVTHVIFPSVCPETFSYLISEIMQMHIPIFCFNIGAQAEKVRLYDKGIVCETVDELISNVNMLSHTSI